MSKVAILLAVYNGKTWLQQQLESILNQVGVTVQVFISVDLSTDGTERFVDRLASTDSRIVILPHGRQFGEAASNFFRLFDEVSLEGFDYVGFADQDDIWLPDKLSQAHLKLSETGADGYASDVTAFWPSDRHVLIKKSQPQKEWDFLFQSGGAGCTIVMSSSLACAIQSYVQNHKDAIKKVWLHDWFCYAFARAKGYKWFIHDYSSMMYRQHIDNQVGANFGWRAILHRARKVVNGWGFRQSIIMARTMGLEKNPFVKRWVNGQRAGLIYLAFKAGSCRRRFRDQIFFSLSCLIMAVTGSCKQ